MWKDSDYRELFTNFQPTPPEQVWTNIALAIHAKSKPRESGYFNYSQRLVLVAASVTSFLLCGIMFCFMEDSPRMYINQSGYPPILEQSNLGNHFPLDKKENAIVLNPMAKNRLVGYRVKKSFSGTLHNLPDELKPFESELMALADLDKQIAKLGEEIATLKAGEVESENWKHPILAEIPSPMESKFNANSQKYRDLLSTESEAKNAEPKFLTTTPADRFYITPYMGANYSFVFYQDKPANNFFSDKAIFSGRIGYNTGVQFGYQFSKHWSIESGVGIGQYIVGFKEDYGTYFRDGDMYIDQLDIPLLARYSFDFNKQKLPLSLAFKGGLIYSNVIFYQVNYTDKFTRIMSVNGNKEEHYKFDVDKSEYNSTQLGYALGFDFDACFSKRISLNFSMLNAMVSQINNFPLFNAEKHRPIQFSSSLSIGTKIRF